MFENAYFGSAFFNGLTVGGADEESGGLVISDGFVLRLSAANGATLEAVLSLVSGVASGGAAAQGATLEAAFSIVAGVASGGAAASGTTLGAISSILAGLASPQDGAATGVTLVASASLVAGTAAGVVSIVARRRMTSLVRNPPYRDPFFPAARGRIPFSYYPRR